MVDIRFCTAGRNRAGAWFIACRETRRGSVEVLTALGFTRDLSLPADRHYDLAARHVGAEGGLAWATNAQGEYMTIAGIPRSARSERG